LPSINAPAFNLLNIVSFTQRDELDKASNTKDNTIDNATHSLFRRQTWIDITDSDYEAISLSLRLSSLLIREVSLLGWWIMLCTERKHSTWLNWAIISEDT
jgi:hypothetical protein